MGAAALTMLASSGFTSDFIGFLMKFDRIALDKLIAQLVKNAQSNQQSFLAPMEEKSHDISHIASLDSTTLGATTLSSGFGDLVYVTLTTKLHHISGGIFFTPKENGVSYINDYEPPEMFFYVIPTSFVIPTSPPVPKPTPVILNTLSASVIIDQTYNLFSGSTARDTISYTQYSPGGQTIDYTLTDTQVSFTVVKSLL